MNNLPRTPPESPALANYRNRRRAEEALVRKRDTEHRRQEELSSYRKYYDKCDQINSRFEAWTQPEYYDQCTKDLEKRKEQDEKDKIMQERKEQLKKFLDDERHQLEEEIRIREQTKCRGSGNTPIPTDVLTEIRDNLLEDEEFRRRKEVEDKLFRQWSQNEGRQLMEATEFNEHKALAKLSWLDQQVDKHMQRERQTLDEVNNAKDKKIELEIEQQELEDKENRQKLKSEELQNKIARGVEVIKRLDYETSLLHFQEKKDLASKNLIENEIVFFAEEINRRNQRDDLFASGNIRQLKRKIIEHIKEIEKDLDYNILLLNRLNNTQDPSYEDDQQYIHMLKTAVNSLEQQKKMERQRLSQIESMYESEVRMMWERQDTQWKKEAISRKELMNEVLDTLKTQVQTKIHKCIKKQKDMFIKKEKALNDTEELSNEFTRVEDEIRTTEKRISEIKLELPDVIVKTNQQIRTPPARREPKGYNNMESYLSPLNFERCSLENSPRLVSPRIPQDSIKNIVQPVYSINQTEIDDPILYDKYSPNVKITSHEKKPELRPGSSSSPLNRPYSPKANMWW